MKPNIITQKLQPDKQDYISYYLYSPFPINVVENVNYSYSPKLSKFNGIQYLEYINLDIKITGFENLQFNWDSYNADPISETAIDKAIDVLSHLYIKGFLSSHIEINVFPMRDGGIQFEFDVHFLCSELEIDKEGTMNYLQFKGEGELYSKIQIFELKELSDFLKETQYQKPQNLTPPQNLIVNGIIHHNRQDKYKITIQTNAGTINGKLNDFKLLKEIKNFYNKEATVYGIGYFKSNGTLNFIKINRILKPSPEDKYFSKIPSAETALQQIERQIAEKPYVNWMEKIAGLWPGNETDEEFEQLLKDMK